MSLTQHSLLKFGLAMMMVSCTSSRNASKGLVTCQTARDCPAGYTCEQIPNTDAIYSVCCKDKGCADSTTPGANADGGQDSADPYPLGVDGPPEASSSPDLPPLDVNDSPDARDSDQISVDASLCNPDDPACLNCVPGTTCDPANLHNVITCSTDHMTKTTTTDSTQFCVQGHFVQCRDVNDCATPDNPCVQAICSAANLCGTTNAAVSTSCAGNGTCDGAGHCNGPASRKSCPAGQALCQGVSCCQDVLVTGGMFPMGLGSGSEPDVCPSSLICDTNAETPEHSATVADFYMDTFEVTVGRFREFYKKYGIALSSVPPVDGAGQNPHVSSSGWQSSAWNSLLAPTQEALAAGLACPTGGTPTWGPAFPPDTEVRAINCVTWYEAFAFCIWDGGRLPTEAEWEYAATAGAADRLYPWGQAAPDSTRANYYTTNMTPLLSVGSFAAGAGTFGQLDLSGGMAEWTFDWYSDSWYASPPGNPCANCANISSPSPAPGYRGTRGGAWDKTTTYLRAASRSGSQPASRLADVGFRCVRDRQ